MRNFTRSTIKKHYKEDAYTTPENLHKYTCQVFDEHQNQVAYIIGNTWEEVNNKFKQLCEEEN